MGSIFSALGQGLQGLERGLLMKREMKEQALDRQIAEHDRALMMQDRAMQQEEFKLRMQQAGLALQMADFNYKRAIADGTPEEQAARQRALEQAEAVRVVEEHALNMEKGKADLRLTDAQIRASDALANYRAEGGAYGMREEDPAKEYEDQIKLLDGQIRVLDDIIDNPESAPEEKAYAQRQKRTLFNQRETLYNSVVAAKGFPITEFGVGEPSAAETTTAPAAPQQADPLDRALRPEQPTGPKLAGDVPDFFKLRPGQSVNPFTGLEGLFLAARSGAAAATPYLFAPTQQIAGTNQNVNLANFTPELIEKMRQMGLVQQRTR